MSDILTPEPHVRPLYRAVVVYRENWTTVTHVLDGADGDGLCFTVTQPGAYRNGLDPAEPHSIELRGRAIPRERGPDTLRAIAHALLVEAERLDRAARIRGQAQGV